MGNNHYNAPIHLKGGAKRSTVVGGSIELNNDSSSMQDISADVSIVVEQELEETNLTGGKIKLLNDSEMILLRKIIEQLRDAVETDSTLDNSIKKNLLNEINALSNVSQETNIENRNRIVRGVVSFCRDAAKRMPEATKFLVACNNMIPQIEKLFDLII